VWPVVLDPQDPPGRAWPPNLRGTPSGSADDYCSAPRPRYLGRQGGAHPCWRHVPRGDRETRDHGVSRVDRRSLGSCAGPWPRRRRRLGQRHCLRWDAAGGWTVGSHETVAELRVMLARRPDDGLQLSTRPGRGCLTRPGRPSGSGLVRLVPSRSGGADVAKRSWPRRPRSGHTVPRRSAVVDEGASTRAISAATAGMFLTRLRPT
jgi:hypothetical protein